MTKASLVKKPSRNKRKPLGTRLGSNVFKAFRSLASLVTNIPSNLGLFISNTTPPPTLTTTEVFEETEDSDRWSTLPPELLFKIFKLLPSVDLFYDVSSVCHSWRLASWEALFWENIHTVDLTSFNFVIRTMFVDMPIDKLGKSIHNKTLRQGIEAMVLNNRRVLGNDQGTVTTLIFPRNMYLTGLEDLTSIAKRSQSVKILVLKDAYTFKDGCLSQALKHWKSLEELTIGPILTPIMTHIIKELGINCNNLRALHININFWMDNEGRFSLTRNSAELIATHLRLKEFSMTKGTIYLNGVGIILNRCKQLSNVCFERCHCLPKLRKERTKTARMKKEIINYYCTSSECIKWSLESKPQQLFTADEVLHHLFN